jgi:acyl-CoA synthetase (AMP-forming)/AMP-acid ligase II
MSAMPQVMELIEDAAAGHGQIRFLPSGETLTFRQAWNQAGDVARWINARQGRGGAIGAVLSNTPACAVSIFGIWRSGNTLVSLPHPGRGMTAERYCAQIVQIAEMSGVTLLLIDARYRDLVPELRLKVATFEETLTGGPPCDTSGSGALIQFTSGSVGTPKGVVLSPEAIAANILSIIDVIEPAPGEVPCSWLPLSHDMGLIGMFLTSIVCLSPDILGQGTFALLTPEYFLNQPAAWLQTCSQVGATITTAPNFALELACRSRDWAGKLDLSRLRMLITGAERVSATTLRRFGEAYSGAGFGPQAICPAYGMAEATLAITMVRPHETWRSLRLDREALGGGRCVPAAGEGAAEYVGNGSPVAGMEVRVAAADWAAAERTGTDWAAAERAGTDWAAAGRAGDALASDGQVGEVQVRGPSLLSRYIGADLAVTPDGWFPTRDVGFMSDGELFLIGRTDDTVIVGGRNYYAPDIEAALSHDAIRPGCLAAVPLDGEGYGLVAEARTEAHGPALERVCAELALKAVKDTGVRPSIVAIVPRGRLPKTPSGKLQRVRIADQIRNGDIEVTASTSLGG